MKFAHIPLCFAMIGCSSTVIPSDTAHNANPTQADLDAISDDCNFPRKQLVLEGGQVTLLPSGAVELSDGTTSDFDFEGTACVFERIKKAGITSFGFVGNERVLETQE